MNQDQLLSVVRTLAPALLTFLAGRYPQYAGLIGQIVAAAGAVGAAGWGAAGHTTSAKIAAVEALPTVQKIVVAPTTDMKPVINDPDRPKVVAQ